MGVHGLWNLLKPVGKPVPVESLENKVLAVDVSIWLHQAARGFRDARGQTLPNAHLLGLFHRLCKLLFWRIRPVFVFDGGAPLLKQQTVAARRQRREGHRERADRMRRRLLALHLKKQWVQQAIARRKGHANLPVPSLLLPARSRPHVTTSSSSSADMMFALPPAASDEDASAEDDRSSDEDDPAQVLASMMGAGGSDAEASSPSSSSSEGEGGDKSNRRPRRHRYHLADRHLDLHAVDVKSADFLALPASVRHDILSELKETRKQSSWGRLHEMPKESGDFSSYQMSRLLQRRSVQASLEAAEQEMGGRTLSLVEMESFMAEAGTLGAEAAGAAGGPERRIAADEHARFIFMKASTSSSAPTPTPAPPPPTTTTTDDSKPLDAKNEELTVADELKDEDLKDEKEKLEFIEETETHFDEVEIQSADTPGPNETGGTLPSKKVFQLPSLNRFYENLKIFSEEEISQWIDESYSGTKTDFSLVELGKCGLTQEQILALIQDQTRCNKMNSSKAGCSEPSTSQADCSNGFESDKGSQSEINEQLPGSSSSNDWEKASDTFASIRPGPSSEKDIPYVPPKENSINLGNGEYLGSFTAKSSKKIHKRNDIQDEVTNRDINTKELNLSLKFGKECYEKRHSPSVFDKKNFEGELKSSSSDKESLQIATKKTYHQTGMKRTTEPGAHVVDNEEYEESSGSSDDLVAVDDTGDLESTVVVGFKGSIEPSRQPSLEVIVQPVTDLDDDIFADVFEGRSSLKEDLKSKSNSSSDMQYDLQISTEKAKVEVDNELSTPVSSNEHDSGNAKEFLLDTFPASTNKSPVFTSNGSYDGGEGSQDELQDHLREEEPIKEKILNAADTNADIIDINIPEKLTDEQLEEIKGALQEEGISLERSQARDERLAGSITEQMVADAQELLQLFGIPYIVAPMEAEAQCAYLELESLTDGTITDDSDIWLFGGRKVYKNFFDQKNHVLQFRDIDIQSSFKLSRSQLVLLAMLVGSDYTTGLRGVGPVTAMEIMAAFPPTCWNGQPEILLEGLHCFRCWYMSSRSRDKEKLRSKLRDVDMAKDFPDIKIVEAYLNPEVDKSLEKFSWGSPNLELIREFTNIKFGWPSSKTMEILQPIMKKLNIKISQPAIDSYFRPKPTLQPVNCELSKRLQVAIQNLDELHKPSTSEDRPISPENTKIDTSVPKKGKKRAAKKQDESGVIDKKPKTNIKTKLSKGGIESKKFEQSNVGEKPSTSRGTPSSLESLDRLPEMHSGDREFIPQREKDKINLLKNKLKAIEVFRKSARGLDKTKRDKKEKRKVLKEANLSESGSSSCED